MVKKREGRDGFGPCLRERTFGKWGERKNQKDFGWIDRESMAGRGEESGWAELLWLKWEREGEEG